MTEQSTEVTRDSLKVQALLQRISALTSKYEDAHADARVDITILQDRVEVLTQELEELRNGLVQPEEAPAVSD